MNKINWNPPEPRHGWLGYWDKFVGPGATNAEEWLQLGGGIALTLVLGALLFAKRDTLQWTPLQAFVAGLFALDMLGGVLTNATNTAKRWYHREGQAGLQAHLPFIAVHGIHLLVVAVVFRQGDWLYFAVNYAYLLGASVLIIRTPLYLQRPMAMAVYCGALLLGMYVFVPSVGLEWFIPLFFLKLFISHLVKEAPFAPDNAPTS